MFETRTKTLVPRLLVSSLLLSPAALAQSAAPLFSGSVETVPADSKIQAVLDLDHDGDLDLLSWWWVGEPDPLPEPRVRITGFLADGEGGYQMGWRFQTPESNGPNCLYAGSAVGDFDGDGFDDFAVGIWGDIFVYATRQDAPPVMLDSFEVPGISGIIEEMQAGDLNGDGLDDLVISNNYRLKGLISGGTADPFTFAGETYIHGQATSFTHVRLAVVDYDQDGDMEAAALRYNEDRIVIAGIDEEGDFVHVANIITSMPWVRALICGDVDGDGDDDLVTFDRQGLTAPGTCQVIRCEGPSNYNAEPWDYGGPATHLIDIDLDGDLDGLCCGGGPSCNWDNDTEVCFEIALNDGNGGFDQAVPFTGLETGYDGLAGVMDFDGDGDLDMIGGRSMLLNHMMTGAAYCSPPVNSTGDLGRMAATGSASLSRSDLTLHAYDLPPNKTAVVVLGGAAAEIPVGSSLLCIQGPHLRYEVVTTDAAGRIDLAIPAASLGGAYPGDVSPGESRRFQVWHRDSNPDGFSFSEALRLSFAP